MEIQTYRDLIVWQRSMDLVEEVYKIVSLLPKEERFALSDQMRRSVVSIPSNIAEGQARKGQKEFLNFLSIAQGSKAELQTQILICERLNYLTREQTKKALALTEEVGKLIYAIVRKMTNPSENTNDR